MAAAALLLAPPARAASQYDYTATVEEWFIAGWTDGMQITCGAATASQLTARKYFGIYRQVWGGSGLLSDVIPKSFWSMDFATNLSEGTDVTVVVDVDDKFHAVVPGETTVDGTANPNRKVVSVDNEGCALERGCEERPANVMMHAIVSELYQAKSLVVTVKNKGGQEVDRIDVSRFGAVKPALAKCFETLTSTLNGDRH